ncbi:hypothetical protein SAMN04244572_04429 [Azotobacter beijerinckii]|uniref:Uncharacterized protein n=1 Tax=Azotobacter beijerinckii TaxID=170623 RepID=A0A1H6YFG8_9GAMM|nr:hypothetical protein [Azotobacter beijerinckii]SEJ40043.1 hypothetical protein SAMN04244579_04219 [Azotobacter beijerinckii]SEJ54701.1 hypothetical protein SAMN04244572_04429 [Azotobacter beijerinckii]SFB42920.1 hypothetical protein SAMN04244571_02764 [Azotobacter beijerinckii]SFL13138.1 hypothetical protein SAMN04244574_03233 [Azotobacter beijerinckii]
MKSLSPIFAALFALSASLAFADAQAGERRVVRTNGQGSGSAVRGISLQGSDGSSLERRASRSRSDDGSRQSERSLSATGSQGSSLQSNGGLTYTAESGLSQSRSTSLTNAATGNSVQGNTSYSRDGGLTRSVACQDASGASIACLSR